MEEQPIKTMKLYSHVDRVFNELRELGVEVNGEGDALRIEGDGDDLQEKILSLRGSYLNYGQRESVTDAAKMMGLFGEDGNSKLVLDVGAGLGQPARAMASLSPDLRILGVELQADQVEVGNKITEVAGFDLDRCKLVAADFLSEDFILPPASADGLVSWLCVLHMGDAGRKKMWERTASFLKPGAKIYIEDFFKLGDKFTDEEITSLREDIYCEAEELPTMEEYIKELEAVGFKDINFDDQTETWTAFVESRFDAWNDAKDRTLRVHNEATFNDLGYFYEAMVKLFQGGNLGGVRLVATFSP
ncbi:Sterol 24-C-methyltransferase [Hondaea fermentalgiana]|uniref:phosphoethanolamine N-methyltransferase n=1 Tax=Hondaea fermentalgiana TaxID=2315210 RepID=A0A2R5G7G7_9STRA|nr:Sterol 24-C-methyltransferase [Hondaea fermentalgiana]|eukprot:GBG26485.1 Sterol 24-C-methyltransferase [Hondaea fermentalgiana]